MVSTYFLGGHYLLGLDHSVQDDIAGRLRGNNDHGQLGDGSTQNRSTPVPVPLPVGITVLSISANRHHSAAVGSDGKLYVWGHNHLGQLGDWSAAALGLSNSPQYPGPANDLFAQGLTITQASGQALGGNNDATREPQEPQHGEQAWGQSVWWVWTAPASGWVSFDTLGSNFNTVLGVYTGASLNTLALVAQNNDLPAETSSRIEFNAQAGTIYRIAVDGGQAQSGHIVLNWRMGQPQSLTFSPTPDQLLTGNPLTTAVSSSSGLPASVSSLSPSICQINGATLTLLTLGACHLLAQQAGNATFLAAPDIVLSFNITAPPVASVAPDGDVPIPPWALLSLSGLLLAVARRRG